MLSGNTKEHMQLIDKAVEAYIAGGLSIIPINTRSKRPAGWLLPQDRDEAGNPLFYRRCDDGTFAVTTDETDSPKGTWKPFQERQATRDEILQWRAAGVQSYAIICGPVSGGVEIMDFDVAGYFEEWSSLVAPEIAGLPIQRTGGGGTQLAFRCPNPEPNQKLAWHPDETQHAGRRVAIETRGVNGYALLPPSLHPSGRRYELLAGRFSQIPTIGQDVRDFLFTVARSLCRAPQTRQELERKAADCTPSRESAPYEGDSVIDAYNAKFDVEALLQRYGYSRLGNGRYSRPGKADSAGVVVFKDTNKTYNMSSNDPLDSDSLGLGQPRSPFDYYVEFEHRGDYKSAVREAAKELGMEYTRPQSPTEVALPADSGDAAGIYNVEALPGASRVFICGSKADVDLLKGAGMPAVCFTGGVWRREWNSQFASVQRVYLLFGNEPAAAETTAKAQRMIRRAKAIALPRWYKTVNDFFATDIDPAGWLKEIAA